MFAGRGRPARPERARRRSLARGRQSGRSRDRARTAPSTTPDFDGGTIRRIAYFSATSRRSRRHRDPDERPRAAARSRSTARASSDPDGQRAHLRVGSRRRRSVRRLDRRRRRPTRTPTPGTYPARLRVTDTQGATGTAQAITITADNTPPTATIDAPAASTTWSVGDTITFAGTRRTRSRARCPGRHCAGTSSSSTARRRVTRTRSRQSPAPSGSFAAPDHEYPSYLELRLTATDAGGLTDTKTLDSIRRRGRSASRRRRRGSS